MDSLTLYNAPHPGGARRGWLGLARVRFDIVLFVFLLATIAAVWFQDAILAKTIVIEPHRASIYRPQFFGDERSGGRSTIRADARVPLKWRCRLRENLSYPHCSYALRFDARTPNKGFDLARFKTITLDMDYAGPWDTFRVYLKNFDARYSQPGISDTLKFNKVEASVRPGRNVVQLSLSDFGVAEWWVTNNKIRPELSTTQLDNVTELEFQTGTLAPPGIYDFRIRRITLRGRLIGEATWYGALLAVWAMLIGLYLVYRIIHLRRDLEQRRRSQAAALRLARYAEESARRDHLTKLSNRTGLTDLYHAMAMSPQGRSPFAAVLLDVDHFKLVNDRFGHACGDEVLTSIAAILGETMRPGDIVGRWGGEEFLLIFAIADHHGALSLANELRARIESFTFGKVGQVTASLGICCSAEATDPLEQVVARADAALYAAKEQGRNRVVLYEPSMRKAA